MQTLLSIIVIISGLITIWSVLLMSAKGGLGMGIGGISAGGEYGGRKSLENKLQKTAIIGSIIFVLACVILPYTLG
jgi:protein translocase SecG subunit